jgi:hypothetical protein
MLLKGLLTYRTIQFSMSSGCCHPYKLVSIHPGFRPASFDRLAGIIMACFFPGLRDKKTERRFNHS